MTASVMNSLFDNRQLPVEFAREQHVLFKASANCLVLGPRWSASAVAEVCRYLGPQIGSCEYCDSEEAFDSALSQLYPAYQPSSEAVIADMQAFIDMEQAAADLEGRIDLLKDDDDAPIIRLLNAILAEALREKASDIHIEPYEKSLRVRFRRDGVLQTVLSPAVQIAPLLVSRIKVMSRLDIAEKRLPQDGRMSVSLSGRLIDLRISTMPSSYGERVVMRVLDKQAGQMKLDDLGMPADIKRRLNELLARPHGIILVTGPTGSGKTTTLYAGLQEMDRQQRNIMTVEDPVEYELPGISQTQINLRAGMTFARSLRAILRQDPDVILIGEIRDGETAEIATQASLTGHLVLSTLHTNTATGAITRLQDLGIDSFLLASTVRGVLAQRLVRRLCLHCRQSRPADAYESRLLNVVAGTTLYVSKGCAECNHSGYSGRIGLFELLELDAELQSMVHDDVGEVALEKAVRTRVPSLQEAGFAEVRQGRTTLDEVLRVSSL